MVARGKGGVRRVKGVKEYMYMVTDKNQTIGVEENSLKELKIIIMTEKLLTYKNVDEPH